MKNKKELKEELKLSFLKEKEKQLQELVGKDEYLDLKIKHLRNDFIRIGNLIMELNQPDYIHSVDNPPLGRPCKNIYEVCACKFNLQKTTCKNLVAVAKKFGFNDKLKENYLDYNFSQLVEMVPLNGEQLEMVSPDMSKRDIRALRKGEKQPSYFQNDKVAVKLKNKTEKLDFLKTWQEWPLWKTIEELGLEIYKVDFTTGGVLLACTVKTFDQKMNAYTWSNPIYRIIDSTYPNFAQFAFTSISDAEYLRYLTTKKALPMLAKDFLGVK